MEIVAQNRLTGLHFAYPTQRSKLRVWGSSNLNCHSRSKLPTPHPPIRIPLLDLKNAMAKPVQKLSSSTPTSKRNINSPNESCTSSDVLRLVDSLGITVTPDIYTSLIEECSLKGDPVQAHELYAHIQSNKRMMNYVKTPSGLSWVNRIMLMYISCRCVEDASQLFDKMTQRDYFSWAIMIAGFVHYAFYEQAIHLFANMQANYLGRQSSVATRVIGISILKACTSMTDMKTGKLVHGWLTKLDCSGDLPVSVELSEFYEKFRCYHDASLVLIDQIRKYGCRDAVIWTKAMMNSYHQEEFEEVVHMFKEMGRFGIRKDEVAFSTVVRACGRLSDGGLSGKQVHAIAIRRGTDSHRSVLCSLVNMYGKSGLVQDARKVFDMIKWDERNRFCWNAMVKSYLENDLCVDAIKVLYEMKAANVVLQDSLLDQVRIACARQ